MEYRLAVPADAGEIAALIAATWNTTADAGWIATAVAQPGQCIWVAIERGTLAGFCAAFPTSHADGSPRWEVDLLAVRADKRGRGTGRELVARSADSGRTYGARHIRALIAVGNGASQRCFAVIGFKPDEQCDLWVGTPVESEAHRVPPAQVRLLPVDTLTYRGIWIEGRYDLPALRSGQHLAATSDRTTAGAVIPSAIRHDAALAGFSHIDTYDWWHVRE